MIKHFSIYQPNAWDNSITPIQILHKIINNLNEVIDVVNAIEDVGFERAKTYTDEQITTVNERINNTNAEIDRVNNNIQASLRSVNQSLTVLSSRLDTYNGRLNNLDTRESAHYTETRQGFVQVYSTINNVAEQLRNYADLKDFYLKQEIEEEIEAIRVVIDDILNKKTIDGFTGQVMTVRQILASRISLESKKKAGNRYCLTWKMLSLTNDGYLFNKSSRFSSNINIIAPTWYNLKRNNYQFSSGQKATGYAINLNTWGAFSNVTLLFFAEIVHKILIHYTSGTQAIADNYKNIDIFKYDEWQAWIANGETVPSIVNVDVSTTYDTTNTYMSLILEQFKQSLSIMTGYTAGYGLYATSANTTTALFGGTNDLPRLMQFIYGNTNRYEYSDYFYN